MLLHGDSTEPAASPEPGFGAGVLPADEARQPERPASEERSRRRQKRRGGRANSTLEREPTSDSAELQGLQVQLQEKEQLIVALTDRLEQAAEQLDRLKRSGADRVVRQGGGLPQDLVQDHRTTLDELKSTLQRWEEMQAGLTLGRIETQISELRDLVVQHRRELQGSPSSVPARAPAAPPAAAATMSGGGNASWWERQKAALLESDGAAPGESAAAGSSAAHAAAALHAPTHPGETGAWNVPELPAPVDLESLTLEEAVVAIQERDRVIQTLREPLVLGQLAAIPPASLDELPETVRSRLLELESQWEAKFRQAELQLSIERARLSREEMQLRQQQEQLRKELQKLSLPEKDGDADGDPGPRRRWFRFLANSQENGASRHDDASS